MKKSLNVIDKNSDNYNDISRVVWYGTVTIVLLCEFNFLNDGFYRGKQEWFWLLGVASFFVGFVVPCKAIIGNTRSVILPLVLSAAWLIQLCAVILYYGYVYIPHSSPNAIFKFDHLVTIITSLFAVSAIVIGWFVHDYSQKNSLRRQHTVNVLNSSRMSDVYVKKQHEYDLMFSAESKISKSQVEHYFKWRKDKDKVFEGMSDTQREKHEKLICSMKAALYLMNHHEFMCAGINNDDLDESYIMETMSYLTVSLHDACKEFIHEVQKRNPDCFEHLCTMAAKWKALGESSSS